MKTVPPLSINQLSINQLEGFSSPVGEADGKEMLEKNSLPVSEPPKNTPINTEKPRASQGGGASCKVNTKPTTTTDIKKRTHLHQAFVDGFTAFIEKQQPEKFAEFGFRWNSIELKGIKNLRHYFVERADKAAALLEDGSLATDAEVILRFISFLEYAWKNSDSFSKNHFTVDYLERKFNYFTNKAQPVKQKNQRQAVSDFTDPSERFTSFN